MQRSWFCPLPTREVQYEGETSFLPSIPRCLVRSPWECHGVGGSRPGKDKTITLQLKTACWDKGMKTHCKSQRKCLGSSPGQCGTQQLCAPGHRLLPSPCPAGTWTRQTLISKPATCLALQAPDFHEKCRCGWSPTSRCFTVSIAGRFSTEKSQGSLCPQLYLNLQPHQDLQLADILGIVQTKPIVGIRSFSLQPPKMLEGQLQKQPKPQ